METVKLKTVSTQDSFKAIKSLIKSGKIRKSGTGQKFYITDLSTAKSALAKVFLSEQTGNMYLKVMEDKDDNQGYYLNPLSQSDFDLIQSLPDEAVENYVPVVIAVQRPDATISEESLAAVEATYGAESTAKFRRARAEGIEQLALVQLGEFEG